MKTKETSAEVASPPAGSKTPFVAVPEGGPSPVVVFLGGGSVALGVSVYAGLAYGAPGVVLTLAATTLVLVIASFWTSIRMLIGETRLSAADAYAIGAQHTELEQKRAVLRALKDLEFERSVGKISEEDYRQLVARFRAEAKALLRVIDEKAQAKRARAAKLVGAHLQRKGVVVPTPVQPGGPSFEKMPEEPAEKPEPAEAEAKPAEAEAKPAEAEAKPAEAEAKPAEAEAKPAEAEAKPAEADGKPVDEPTEEAK